MRRVWVLISSALLVTSFGCGKESYEKRLNRTLEKLKYENRIRKNLMEAVNEKKFQDLGIYIRPPKDEAYAKTGQLPVTEGQFDLDASFNDKSDASLHLLARVKMPKKAPTKGAPPPPPPPQRGEFAGDVIGVLSTVFGSPDVLQTPKFSEENKKQNRFRRLIFNANDKDINVYLYKQDGHEVALIFVYDPKLKNQLSSKIELCLESFATGEKAKRLFSGGGEEEPEATPAGPI